MKTLLFSLLIISSQLCFAQSKEQLFRTNTERLVMLLNKIAPEIDPAVKVLFIEAEIFTSDARISNFAKQRNIPLLIIRGMGDDNLLAKFNHVELPCVEVRLSDDSKLADVHFSNFTYEMEKLAFSIVGRKSHKPKQVWSWNKEQGEYVKKE